MSENVTKNQEIEKSKPTYTPTPWEEMESWFENLFPRWARRKWGDFNRESLPKFLADFSAPSVDVLDHDTQILVRVEIPGISKDDLDISVSNDTVTIRGTTRKENEKEEKGSYYRREISSRSVDHTIRLPSSVDSEQATASLKDGILEITLTKKEDDGSRHKVAIS